MHDRELAELPTSLLGLPALGIGAVVPIEDGARRNMAAQRLFHARLQVLHTLGCEASNGNDREVRPACYSIKPELAREAAENLEIATLDENCATGLGELRENRVDGRAQHAEDAAELIGIPDPGGSAPRLVHDEDFVNLGFRHNLWGVRGDQHVGSERPEDGDELSLQIGVQVDVGFVDEKDRRVSPLDDVREHLAPDLKAEAGPEDLPVFAVLGAVHPQQWRQSEPSGGLWSLGVN